MFPADWNPSVVHMPSVRMLGGTHPHEHAAGARDGHDRRQCGDAVVSDPVEARPSPVTPACLLPGLFGLLLLGFGIPSWLGRPSSGLPAASWLPPRPSSGLRLRPSWRRRAPCRTPACRRAWRHSRPWRWLCPCRPHPGLVRLIQLGLRFRQLLRSPS